MTLGKITLSGHIVVPVDRLKAVRDALPRHVTLTRAEPGCLVFNVVENAKIAGQFEVYEEFADRPSFDAHQARGAKSEWAQITAGIARHYQISEGS